MSARSKRPSGKKILRSGPYHLASSSLAGAAAGFDLGGGAAFFLEKNATVLNTVGLDGVGANRAAPANLSGFPSISEVPKEAGAAVAAREAMDLPEFPPEAGDIMWIHGPINIATYRISLFFLTGRETIYLVVSIQINNIHSIL